MAAIAATMSPTKERFISDFLASISLTRLPILKLGPVFAAGVQHETDAGHAINERIAGAIT
jgi:hypothetical protein